MKQGPCKTCGGFIPQMQGGWSRDCEPCRFARTLEGQGVPPEVVEAIEYEVAREGLEYDDNYRVYRVKDNFMRQDYMLKEKRGCCGFFYGSTIDYNGDKWIIACNHGH